MFAKHKLQALSSSSLFRRSSGLTDRLKAFGPKLMATVQKPYVAPLAALGLFIAGGVLFLNLASDPNAGSPSVRVALSTGPTAKPAADAPAATTEEAPTGREAFTLDSIGLFQDAPADSFTAKGEAGPVEGTAVITLPNDAPIMASSGVKLAAKPLAPAPIAGLHQSGPGGPLPIVSTDGRSAAQAYARPFKSNGRPMVALIVGGLGLNPATTRAAIEQLPAEVTLSFVPYAEGLQGWIDMARAQGHEVLIEMPMEPVDYPDVDPGPYTLLAGQRNEDMYERMNAVLGSATGYFGVTNYKGSAFLRNKPSLSTFMTSLKARGLSFIDDGQARGQAGAWSRASADRVIDAQINAQSINAQLAGLEATAKGRGSALGTGFAYPVTLAVAIRWTQSLEQKGLQLAPASAIVRK